MEKKKILAWVKRLWSNKLKHLLTNVPQRLLLDIRLFQLTSHSNSKIFSYMVIKNKCEPQFFYFSISVILATKKIRNIFQSVLGLITQSIICFITHLPDNCTYGQLLQNTLAECKAPCRCCKTHIPIDCWLHANC